MSRTNDTRIKHGPHRYDSTVPENVQILDDGFGNQWEKCGADCQLEIVRPGKVQCERERCPWKCNGDLHKP